MKTAEIILKKATIVAIVAGCASVLLAIVVSLLLELDQNIVCFNAIVGLFVFIKIYTAMLFSQGWRVFKRPVVLGMPRLLAISYFVSFLSVFILLICSSKMSDNVFGFFISILFALISTFIMWYAGVGERFARGSEYDARLEYQNKGYSEKEIEAKIVNLKDQGIL